MIEKIRKYYDLESLWALMEVSPNSLMKLEVIAVSNKLSNWENEGLNYYLKQFPKYVKFFLMRFDHIILEGQSKQLKIQNLLLLLINFQKNLLM